MTRPACPECGFPCQGDGERLFPDRCFNCGWRSELRQRQDLRRDNAPNPPRPEEDDRCKWCGERHLRVPNDLCALGREEYDDVTVALQAARLLLAERDAEEASHGHSTQG